ncbi:tyrosine-type recombinase/integrase [Blautia faecis]|uniref:tyrosine-type recombinase/integrase n=1 Tax=Blautia faecis TaxID=871665 RepID=UPI001D0080AB|nr:tyrosine-type recombinase/integrase [Blautia faecis]MCB5433147.1 tyrosine-type recombinase/integrase [Blautia faecis]
MFWTRAILWKIIKVLGYLIGMVRYFPARKRNIFFVPYLTRPHILRHTACTRMAEAGMDPKILQGIMGHSDISMTMNVYNHGSIERMQNEMKKLEKYM